MHDLLPGQVLHPPGHLVGPGDQVLGADGPDDLLVVVAPVVRPPSWPLGRHVAEGPLGAPPLPSPPGLAPGGVLLLVRRERGHVRQHDLVQPVVVVRRHRRLPRPRPSPLLLQLLVLRGVHDVAHAGLPRGPQHGRAAVAVVGRRGRRPVPVGLSVGGGEAASDAVRGGEAEVPVGVGGGHLVLLPGARQVVAVLLDDVGADAEVDVGRVGVHLQ